MKTDNEPKEPEYFIPSHDPHAIESRSKAGWTIDAGYLTGEETIALLRMLNAHEGLVEAVKLASRDMQDYLDGRSSLRVRDVQARIATYTAALSAATEGREG